VAVYIDIDIQDLPKSYQKYNLIASKDGVSDSVFFLSSKYILKVFKSYTKEEYKNEKYLLEVLKNSKVSNIIDSFYIKNNFCILYSQIYGLSIKQIQNNHLVQIAIFLKNMHKISKNKISSNKQLFTKNNLKNMIINSNNVELLKIYNSITINLQNHGIIHGDLFSDNCKFKNNKLSGVYDFSQACNGDFIFDLAVIAMSWCYEKHYLNKQKVLILMKAYDLDISYNKFKIYIKYALLYYTTSRYIHNRDYKELYLKLLNI
jgi:homoserine kinase type II